jgi:hypothetical protein
MSQLMMNTYHFPVSTPYVRSALYVRISCFFPEKSFVTAKAKQFKEALRLKKRRDKQQSHHMATTECMEESIQLLSTFLMQDWQERRESMRQKRHWTNLLHLHNKVLNWHHNNI